MIWLDHLAIAPAEATRVLLLAVAVPLTRLARVLFDLRQVGGVVLDHRSLDLATLGV